MSSKAGVDFNCNQRIWNAFPEYYNNTWKYYKEFIRILKSRGVRFVTMSQAYERRFDAQRINMILDHHIDHYPIETEVMARWENDNDVVSSIYLFRRVLASHPSQKVTSWAVEDLDCDLYHQLEAEGFEIGFHHNAVGQARMRSSGCRYRGVISDCVLAQAQEIFVRDLQDLRELFHIRTVIPHGGGEGNTQLADIENCGGGLIWAYNGRPKNKNILKWENFNDSAGQNMKVVVAPKAKVVVGRDALHVKAWLAGPGLHHVLLHPGRFGRGMPYELYSRSDAIQHDKTTVMFTGVYPSDVADIPLRVSRLVEDWEGEAGRAAREADPRLLTLLPVRPTNEKYYLLTDDALCLRQHLAVNDQCIGFRLVAQKFDTKQRKKLQRDKLNNHFYSSHPVQPDCNSFADPKHIDSLFLEQFYCFFNTIYAAKPWHHLALSEVPYAEVCLLHTDDIDPAGVKRLFTFLCGLPFKTRLCLRLPAQICSWRRKLTKLIRELEKQRPKLVLRCGDHVFSVANAATASVKSGEDLWIIDDAPMDRTHDEVASVHVPADNTFLHTFNTLTRESFPSSGDPGKVTAYDHHYVAQVLFSRRFKSSDADLLLDRGCPAEWVAKVAEIAASERNKPPYGGAAYRKFVRMPSDPDLLYSYLKKWMQSRTRLESLDECVQTQGFAWPWSSSARCALEAWKRTGDTRFPKLIIDTFEPIAQVRDCETGRVDQCRGRVLKSWGSTYYDNYAMGKGYTAADGNQKPRWTCNATAAGRIVYPLAAAIEALSGSLEGDQLCGRERYLAIARDALYEFVDDLREEGPDQAYLWRAERGEHEPLNHQNSYAEAAIKVGQMMSDPELTDIGTRIATYFKTNIQADEGDTCYWAYKGRHGLAELKKSQLVEDIAHAHLNIAFARNCHNMGVVFDESDMVRFARSFARNIYLGDKRFLPRISHRAVPGSLVMKPIYPGHFLAWIQLADFMPDIAEIVESVLSYRFDYYPLNWFESPTSAFAYAWRA